jgi:hypothetical protein
VPEPLAIEGAKWFYDKVKITGKTHSLRLAAKFSRNSS